MPKKQQVEVYNLPKTEASHKIEPSSKFQKTIGYEIREVDGEMTIYDMLADRSFHLNHNGTIILKTLFEEKPIKEVSEKIAALFHLETGEAYKVCVHFTEELLINRLISKHNE